MPVIDTKIDSASEAFGSNSEAMTASVKEFRDIEALMRSKEEKYRPKAEKRGKLLPRERLARLLDPGAPFLELMSIAGYKMYGDRDGSTAGGSNIAGLGEIAGRRCVVSVNNFAIKGGTMNAVSVRKVLRLQEICMENKLPLVTLCESGGGNLAPEEQDPWMAYTFIDGGRCFHNQAVLSAMGIPQVTVVHGNATAGGAYQPGLSDYIILTRDKTQMFLAGPPLLKAATGEICTAEELGGAEMHATVSGTGEYLAEDDADALRIAREVVAQLPDLNALERKEWKPPRYPVDDLLGIVPTDPKTPYDCREVVARIADDSSFLEFSAAIDQGTICGHLRIEGHRVGVLGNNAPITPKGAVKAAQFLQLLDQSRTPVIFLHNTTGFLVGKEAEQGGAIKHGSKMIQAVSNMRAPKISLVLGASYGAGNYAMCSRSCRPRFVFSWPTAKTAVMGGEQAAGVLLEVAKKRFAPPGGGEPDPAVVASIRGTVIAGMAEASEAKYCSARLFDDALIDPRDTRRVLAFALETCLRADATTVQPNTFGIGRL